MRDLPLGGRLDGPRRIFGRAAERRAQAETGFRRFGIRALFGAGNYAHAMPLSNSKRFEALRLASARFTPIQPDRPESSELFTALDSVRCPRRVNALKLTMFSMSERFGTKPACVRRTAQVDFGQKSLFPLNPWEDLMSPYLSLQRFLLVAGTAALLVGPLAMPAGAALLAYDSFTVGAGPADYLAGDEDTGTDVLGGQNPATGPTAFYAGGWIQPAGDSQVVKNIGSLAYPLFPQAGGQIQETLQFDCCTFGRSGREIAGGLGGGRDPRTIYQSFLIDFGTQGTDAPTDFGKRAYEMWSGGMGDSNLAVDLFVNHFTGVNELTLAVTTASGTQSVLVDGGG